MTLSQLEKALNKSLDDFNEEINFLIDSHDDEHLTKDDIEGIAERVFYTMHDFKKNIIMYLRS